MISFRSFLGFVTSFLLLAEKLSISRQISSTTWKGTRTWTNVAEEYKINRKHFQSQIITCLLAQMYCNPILLCESVFPAVQLLSSEHKMSSSGVRTLIFFFPFVYFCIVLCLIYSTLVEDCTEESVPGTHLILTVTIFEHISNRSKLLFNPPVWDGKVLSTADRDERRHWAIFSVQYREKMPSARKVSGSLRSHSNTLIHQVIIHHALSAINVSVLQLSNIIGAMHCRTVLNSAFPAQQASCTWNKQYKLM